MVILTLKDFVFLVTAVFLAAILYELCKTLVFYIKGIFCWKGYAKLYNPYPSMLLDRKYGVIYKKHWWQKWTNYMSKTTYGESNSSLTLYEANELIRGIKKNGFKYGK